MNVNEARKCALAGVARLRLAYQEYLQVLESIDKTLEKAFINRYCAKLSTSKAKLKKKDRRRQNTATKHPDVSKKHIETEPANDTQSIVDESEEIQDAPVKLPGAVVELMERRRRFIAEIGSVFEGKDEQCWKIPKESIYAGLPDNISMQPIKS